MSPAHSKAQRACKRTVIALAVLECGLILVAGLDLHLSVASVEIESLEVNGAADRLDGFDNPRQRIDVALCHQVKASIIDAEPLATVAFLYQDNRETPRTVALLDHPAGQHYIDVRVDRAVLMFRVTISPQVDQRCCASFNRVSNARCHWQWVTSWCSSRRG